MEVLSEFFRTLPEVGRALWSFMNGFYGIGIFLLYLVLAAGLLFLAKRWRDTRTWLSAVAGMMGAGIGFLWAFGIVPSAFTYFMDAERELLEGTIVPGGLPAMDNFYEVFRDSVVMVETGIGIVAFGLIMAMLQKRYPRTLVEGEQKGPATGGYK